MAGSRKVQYLASLCASFAFIFNGAVLTWGSPVVPKLKRGEENLIITDAQASWIISILNLGAIPGSFVGQKLTERIGRRRTIYFATVPAFLGATIIIFTRTPWLMMVARFLMGINIGMTAVVSLIYITEIAVKEIRGGLGMLIQIMLNVGGILMYGIGPFVSYTTLNIVFLIIPLLTLLVCIWIPESPYYHLKDGRIEQAKKEFMKIKGYKNEKMVADELGVIKAHVTANMENRTTFIELVTNKRYRKAIYIVIGLKCIQYMTGYIAIQSYLEMIFRQSSSLSGPLVSIVYGFVQLSMGIITAFLTRWFGARILLCTSSLGVGISLTIVGLYFYLQDYVGVTPEVLSTIKFLPLAGILGFNVLYIIGLGSVTTVMQAELFPINVKTIASSSATMLACVLCFIVAKCYQSIKDAFGHYTVFWSFAAVAYVGLLFVYFFVPETKGKTLEEVQDNMDSVKMTELQVLKENKESSQINDAKN